MSAAGWVRARRSPWTWFRLGLAIIAISLVAAINLYLAVRSAGLVASGAPAVDWYQYVEASHRVMARGQLFAVTDTYGFHYSPLFAYLFGPISLVGTFGWRLLHLSAAIALPTWPMRAIALVSWPFWYDVETGNILVFVVLAAAWALRGNRVAIGAFLLLTLLVPRPLMLPVAAWLLWRHPEWRLPFAIGFVVHGAIVLAMGWAVPWLGALMAAGGDVLIPSNVGPSRFIGAIPWLVIGAPLAVFLTMKGRLGLASLAASPYWLPYYVLVLLLELPRQIRTRRAGESPVP